MDTGSADLAKGADLPGVLHTYGIPRSSLRRREAGEGQEDGENKKPMVHAARVTRIKGPEKPES